MLPVEPCLHGPAAQVARYPPHGWRRHCDRDTLLRRGHAGGSGGTGDENALGTRENQEQLVSCIPNPRSAARWERGGSKVRGKLRVGYFKASREVRRDGLVNCTTPRTHIITQNDHDDVRRMGEQRKGRQGEEQCYRPGTWDRVEWASVGPRWLWSAWSGPPQRRRMAGCQCGTRRSTRRTADTGTNRAHTHLHSRTHTQGAQTHTGRANSHTYTLTRTHTHRARAHHTLSSLAEPSHNDEGAPRRRRRQERRGVW